MKLYRDFASQEEIDREYHLGLAVPDFKNWAKWYIDESEITREKLDCILDVPYGPSVDETVDLFPAKEQGAPLMLFIHGGYWFSGSSKDYSFVANGLVGLGFTVVVMSYSLCPKVAIPEITRQSRAVCAWLYKKASAFNADPSRIFVAGHSSGGHQVGMLMATDWLGEYGLPNDIIKGGISISGLFDLRPFSYSYLQPKLLLTHEVILHQSPSLNIPQSAPPLLITYGEDETAEFQRQSIEYFQALRDNGLQVELLAQESKHHFAAIEGFDDSNSILCQTIIDFMVRCEKI